MAMKSESRCLKCGALLAPEARQDFCPACLYTQAEAESSRAEADEADAAGEVPGPASEQAYVPTGTRFGDYELLERIGQGGMGVVYKARQISLDRVVALKMLQLSGASAQPEYVKRFHAEATAAAGLQHPHIVAIHEVGVHEGQHYYVMDFVEGKTLAQVAGHQPLPARRAARYLQSIAQAVHYAHEHGILHRDLKPSNILIDAEDQPRIADFGLAKRLGADSELTVTGQVLGSPQYIAPEQAWGSPRALTPQSDVYGLGTILYHLLTGRPPFLGEHPTETLFQVLHLEPVALRALNPSVPPDLETLCLKCLDKDPGQRYPTAQMLAEDLGRFLAGEPVLVRPVGRPAKVWRWCRRKPAVAALSLAVLLLALALMIGAPLVALYEAKLRADAEAALAAFRGNAAKTLPARGGAAGALDIFEGAVRRFPNHPQLWNVKGLLLEQNGRIDEAVQDFTRAISLAEAQPGFAAAELSEFLLNRSRALRNLDRLAEAGRDYCRAKRIPVRETNAPAALIDLSLFYDVPVTESLDEWRGRPGKELAGLATGIQSFGGVPFDVRGVIELQGALMGAQSGYRQGVTNIVVRVKFRQLHCLMGTGWDELVGNQVGILALHFADGKTRELPVSYGIHVRDWIVRPTENDDPLEHAVVAWTGENDFARSLTAHVRLYRVTWPNPRPDLEVAAIDFVSTMTRCAPFLVAMTVEP